VAPGAEFLAQGCVVLDDAVVNDGDVAPAVAVRVGVLLRRRPVRSCVAQRVCPMATAAAIPFCLTFSPSKATLPALLITPRFLPSMAASPAES
jgi:hypothetical protein